MTRLTFCTSLTPRAPPWTRRKPWKIERPSSRKGAGPEKHAQNGVLESLPFLQNLRVPPPGPRPRAELRARFAQVLERLLERGRGQSALNELMVRAVRPPLRRALGKALWPPRKSLRVPTRASSAAAWRTIPSSRAGREAPASTASLWGVGASPRPRTSSPPPPGGVSAPLGNAVKM